MYARVEVLTVEWGGFKTRAGKDVKELRCTCIDRTMPGKVLKETFDVIFEESKGRELDGKLLGKVVDIQIMSMRSWTGRFEMRGELIPLPAAPVATSK